jgi:hypothetical protein
VLSKTSINPKISKRSLASLLPATIDSLVCSIWNESVRKLGYEQNGNLLLNYYLAYEETISFSPSECLKELLFSGNSINLEHPVSVNRFSNLKNPGDIIIEEMKSLLKDNAYDLNILCNDYLKEFDIVTRLYIAYRLSFPLNIKGFIEYIKDNYDSYESLPAGVIRYIEMDKLLSHFNSITPPEKLLNKIYNLSSSLRKKLDIPLPPRALLLVEGITEEILLPSFARLLSYDLNTDGILLISSGGKNKVGKLYNKFKRQLNIPIAVLLDADATEIIDELRPIMRPTDNLISLQCGEFEDLLPKDLICKAINKAYMLSPALKLNEIDQDSSIARQLNVIWKELGLGDFNKSQFAQLIQEHLDDPGYVTEEMNTVIEEIYKIL